jgi:23S rRNA-/tRNA-specific pseudouridylate synthase
LRWDKPLTIFAALPAYRLLKTIILQIHIIEETKDWLVVSKPAGIQVERNPFGPSVESLVYAHLEAERRNPYVGIVHRLDRVTTGVVLVAKHRSVLRKLNRQFVEKDVRKTYLAAVSQPPPSEQGTLHHWLEKDRASKRAIVHKEPAEKARECLLPSLIRTTTSCCMPGNWNSSTSGKKTGNWWKRHSRNGQRR